MFYDIYNMKLSVVIYPYPTSLPLANAAPIASQSLGTNPILKLKYFRISLYSMTSIISFMFYDICNAEFSVITYPYTTFSRACKCHCQPNRKPVSWEQFHFET